MSDDLGTDFFTVTDGLIDQWCERRALRRLRILPPAYPPNGLTDGWHELYDAPRDVRSACGGEMPEGGKREINQAGLTIQKMPDGR